MILVAKLIEYRARSEELVEAIYRKSFSLELGGFTTLGSFRDDEWDTQILGQLGLKRSRLLSICRPRVVALAGCGSAVVPFASV